MSQFFLSILLGFASWKFIETPFRRINVSSPRKASTIALSIGVMTIIVIASFLFKDLKPAIPKDLAEIISDSEIPYRVWQNENGIHLGINKASTDFIVLGDSYAGMYGKVLNDLASNRGLSGIIFAKEGCAVLDEIHSREGCYESSKRRLNFALNSTTRKVILIADWRKIFYKNENWYRLADMRRNNKLLLYSLGNTLEKLIKAGKSVFILLPVPGRVGSPIEFALESIYANNLPVFRSNLSSYYNNKGIKKIIRDIKELQSKYEFEILDPAAELCKYSSGCVVYSDKKPIYHDGDHLTYYGADLVKPILLPIFEN
jgi:hypothetical protein